MLDGAEKLKVEQLRTGCEIAVGKDVRSVFAKFFLLKKYGILPIIVIPTDVDSGRVGKSAYETALNTTRVNTTKIKRIVGTGYDRVSSEMFDETVPGLGCCVWWPGGGIQ